MFSKFDFINKAKYFIIISIILVLAGIVSIVAKKGFKLGIDFAGGTAFNIYFPAEVKITSFDLNQILLKNKISGEVTTSRSIAGDKKLSFYITINEEIELKYKNQKVKPSDLFIYEIYRKYDNISIDPIYDDTNSIIIYSKSNSLTIEKLIEILGFSQIEKSKIEIDEKIPEDVDEKTMRLFSSKIANGRIFNLKDNSGYKAQIAIKKNILSSEKKDILNRFKEYLVEKISLSDFTKIKIEGRQYIGPKIGSYFIRVSIEIIILVSILILIYVAIRFRFKFGFAAVVALIHDTLIMIGFVSIFNLEMDISIVAAVLTIIGYSINDTIVIFDRIRENTEKISLNKDEYIITINKSIYTSLSRTIITSLTTLFVVVVLLIWGGDVIFNFYLLLLFGVLVGTYSSIFIASPILVYWERFVEKKLKKTKKKKKKQTA